MKTALQYISMVLNLEKSKMASLPFQAILLKLKDSFEEWEEKSPHPGFELKLAIPRDRGKNTIQ